MLICLCLLDETGSDRRDQLRKFSYSLIGTTPTYHRLLARGTRVNAIASMSTEGLMSVELVQRSVNGDIFFDYITGNLIPKMSKFPDRQSVVVMDNCSIHCTQEVQDVLQQAGILAIYLPPYSPDLMPLEESFSSVKSYLRKHDSLLQAMQDPADVMHEAFRNCLTKENCCAWIRHAGYYST